jgi:hypothetical protein
MSLAPTLRAQFIIISGRDNSMAAKNPAEHHLCICSVLQLGFIVHKKLSGNLSSTDALYSFDCCSRVFSITGWLVYVLHHHLVFNVIFSCL